ncbi:MAG: hypothetical protein HYX34_11415 [Actinobacteria bacterium]|nr:hypothetical protein [Actinomycetota bacterium]
MSELPQGWAKAYVSDVAVDVSSGFASGIHNADGVGVPHLRPMNVNRNGEIDMAKLKYVAADAGDRRLTFGDVLFNNTNSPALVGKSAPYLSHELVAFSNHMTRVRLADGMVPSFVARQLHHLWASGGLSHLISNHVNQASIASSRLADDVRLCVAPTAEQGQIVVAIEEAFSKLDAGEAGLRTVRQLLKRMRDAVLAAAVSGRLVPQDLTDTPATNVLADLGAQSINPPLGPSVPRTWAWCALGSLARGAGYGTSVKCGYEETGIGVLRIPNVQRGALDLGDLKRAPSGAPIDAELLLKPGDLLIVRTNGSRDLIGRCAPVTSEVGCSFASYLIRFRTLVNAVDARFLSMLLTAPWWRGELESAAASSAGQYNLSLRTLIPLPVALPPLEEQARIVAEVERHMSFIDACGRAVDAALVRSAALRRSILKSAFEGRLVPQDPTDEPASVLLERIRDERAAAPKAKPRRAGAKA